MILVEQLLYSYGRHRRAVFVDRLDLARSAGVVSMDGTTGGRQTVKTPIPRNV
jgi:hypothetical protein